MPRRRILAATAALAIGTPAVADMGYNYFEANLLQGSQNGTGYRINGTGARFEGALEIEQELHGFLGFGFHKLKGNGATHRFSGGSLGVGGHIPLSDSLHVTATVAAERLKRRVTGGGGESSTGWGVTGGLRGQVGEKIQWTAGIRYRSLENLQSIYGLMAGGRYYFNPGFALGLDLSAQKYDPKTLDATESVAALTFRFDFGTRY